MTTMNVVGECFFWYRLTRVVPDNFHRAVKWLCVCLFVTASEEVLIKSKWKVKIILQHHWIGHGKFVINMLLCFTVVNSFAFCHIQQIVHCSPCSKHWCHSLVQSLCTLLTVTVHRSCLIARAKFKYDVPWLKYLISLSLKLSFFTIFCMTNY